MRVGVWASPTCMRRPIWTSSPAGGTLPWSTSATRLSAASAARASGGWRGSPLRMILARVDAVIITSANADHPGHGAARRGCGRSGAPGKSLSPPPWRTRRTSSGPSSGTT